MSFMNIIMGAMNMLGIIGITQEEQLSNHLLLPSRAWEDALWGIMSHLPSVWSAAAGPRVPEP